MLTSNKGFEKWGDVFGDEVMVAALIDQLAHYCHVVTTAVTVTACVSTPSSGERSMRPTNPSPPAVGVKR